MMPANAGEEAEVPPVAKKLKVPLEEHEGELPGVIASASQTT
jgi:hypothetical protein